MNPIDFIRNEVAYRSGRIADFWEPKLEPILTPISQTIGKLDTAHQEFVDNNPISQTAQSLPVPGEKIFSKIDKAETNLIDLARQSIQATGLDPRLTGLALTGLTITNPKRLARGVKQGIASGPDFGPAMERWSKRRNELIEQRRYPSGLTNYRRDKNRKKALVTAYNDVSTGPSTDPDDVIAYGSKKFKEKGKEQHHLFPKQESYRFVEAMKKLGDDDDVLNLFLYAEELDATMGGRLSNMLNMDKNPHLDLHGTRIKDGRQLKEIQMKHLVESAKSTDELMDLFDQYILDNIQPSKAEAIALQKAFSESKSNLNRFKSLTEDARRRL
ncbi:MAG: hypothetical protein GY920_03145 [Aliivibrio sp.]|nr:hypothetical protein [Aliivibrio sp.]